MWVIQNILAEVAKDPSYNPLHYTLDLAEESYKDESLLALIPMVRSTRVCVFLCTVLLKSALRFTRTPVVWHVHPFFVPGEL